MKKLSQVIAIAGLLSLSSGAYALQAPQTTGAPATLDDGSLLYAELSKTVDAKKARVGDPVTGLLLADVLSHGKIVARRDSKLVGHVTEAQPRSKENPESRLGIVFDKIILKGGEEMPFLSILMALRPALRPVFDVPSAPAPPYMNPASNAPQDKHYPSPKVNSPKMTTDKKDNDMTVEMKARAQEMSGLSPISDIEGLSLTPGSKGGRQAIVSNTKTVKLEGGIRLDLRVTGAGQ
jgi:hypothetical protein